MLIIEADESNDILQMQGKQHIASSRTKHYSENMNVPHYKHTCMYHFLNCDSFFS